MTKQEFLAFSLPYKLFFRIEYGSTNQPTGIYQMSGVYETSVVEGFNYDNNVKTDKLKPILHPLTDLTKEIEHNDEVFTPYIELLRLSGFNIDDMTQSELNDYKYAYSSINADPMLIPFLDGLKLIEWHFDLFNGIESGEAIDVNTLDENPYK